MFKVGDLVKVDLAQISFMGIPDDMIGGLLVVNDVITANDWNGSALLELRNSDGEYFGLNEDTLEAV